MDPITIVIIIAIVLIAGRFLIKVVQTAIKTIFKIGCLLLVGLIVAGLIMLSSVYHVDFTTDDIMQFFR